MILSVRFQSGAIFSAKILGYSMIKNCFQTQHLTATEPDLEIIVAIYLQP